MMISLSFASRAALVVLLLISAGCARGADEARLQTDLQQKLDQDVKQGLFEVVGVNREGSGPLADGPNGAERVVVYFNATLKVGEAYTFGGWDQLNASSVAYVLGATEKGLFGLKPENQPGDLVRVYGSAVYERNGNDWVLGVRDAPRTAEAPNIEGTSPPSRSKQLIDRLAALVEVPPPGVPPQQDEIIADELTRASENIERRVKRREHTYTIATGPTDGEYARLGRSLIDTIRSAAPDVKLRERLSEGSIENAWLLGRGEADYALVQADVAAVAFAGTGPFAQGGPSSKLRAVSTLFPEAVHVVVPQSSSIQQIGQLRGKRVAIGPPTSGTRFDAVAVLGAHGVAINELAEACEESTGDALLRLARGTLDAVVLTSVLPSRALQDFAVRPGLRLLPVTGPALEQLVAEHPGLAPLTLPANTYPNQREALPAVGTMALLVTTADAPTAEVERVVDVVSTRVAPQRARPNSGDDVARVAAQTELRGVTIPLHPGASALQSAPRPVP